MSSAKRLLWLGFACGAVLLAADTMTPVLSAQPAAKPAARQVPAKAAKIPRTPDGRPDLDGIWDWRTIVPMQRPREMAARAELTEADIQHLEEQRREEEQNGDNDPNAAYNRFWFDQGLSVGANRRTSIITDPPDGRYPSLTPEAQRRANSEPWSRNPRSERRRFGPLENPEEVNLASRCLMGQNSGPPMQPGFYNHNLQIVQTPTHVMMLTEMIHQARVIALDGRPHVPVPQWSGSARGRWEGDTLVVESRHFNDRGVGTLTFNTDANMVIVERFSLDDPETLRYEFTVNDPTVWTRPWSGLLHMKKSAELMYEYACHEGNYSLKGMLAGARAEEAKAAGKTINPRP